MIHRKSLLIDLQRLLPKVEADLLERSASAEVPEVGAKLREEFAAAQAADRTAQNFEDWRTDSITQVAAAWVLSCVFVRFLEDNELVRTPALAGPGERLKRARDEHELYFRSHPTLTDRDYLLTVFDGLTKHAATKEVFGAHNPIRDLPNWLSGDAAGDLIAFFQKIEPSTGALVHDFTDPAWDTRFLGDLYQDLSEAARKKYALLQTPVFVEEFILDRTLDPAIEEFGLAKMGYQSRLVNEGRLDPTDRFKMIDPACGSGHFLLGSFARLVDRWRKKEHGDKDLVLIQRALDGVHGVDLNPYAIAIARFRLLLAALKECGIQWLHKAPGFEIHLVCGDSLLHGSPAGDQLSLGWNSIDHAYQPEDRDVLETLLRPRNYHAVVTNPPYITPKDRSLNQAYRDRYKTCQGKYPETVPFLERIVSLAVEGGFTGQITANSFMKREFGKKLIETYFPRVDLTHVVDTSGAYIPGHGTPTVILFIRNQEPVANTVRTVMAIRGEPSTPDDPSRGLVWLAIVSQIDHPGSQSEFVSVADTLREVFHKHPWSIGGGGAAELKNHLDNSIETWLEREIIEIGRTTHTGEDDAFYLEPSALKTLGLRQFAVPLVTGEDVRDYLVNVRLGTLFPYNLATGEPITSQSVVLDQHFWRLRTNLKQRRDFGRFIEERGLRWFDHSMFFANRYRSPFSIAFAFVATHNHFVFDRGIKVFNRHSPVIKLPSEATVDNHLGLLGLLNSSTACFWMKQTFFDRGNGGIGGGISDESWEHRFDHDGTKLQKFPLPEERPTVLARKLDDLAQRLQSLAPDGLLQRWESRGIMPGTSVKDSFSLSEREWTAIREQMIALQEELDWECYRLYQLIDDDLTYGKEPPQIRFGGRAFEIAMGQRIAAGELQTTWFERHHATPLPGPHPDWPQDYQNLVRRRIEICETNPNLRLIEQPEYKRRWNTEPWADQLARALRSWLLDRLESYFDFDGRMHDDIGKETAEFPISLVTIGKLADIARRDPEFLEVGALYRDDAAFDVSRLVAELVESESVPLLPILRYKPTGLRKREEWEKTWELQREEDRRSDQLSAVNAQRSAIPKDQKPAKSGSVTIDVDALAGDGQLGKAIVVPPKYTSADFLKTDCWRLRGKLDVPKERWVSFPLCEGEDGTLLIAWAGYDHLQLARAISTYFVDVQERFGGRDDPRLVPLLACLIELLPWLKQWHNEIDPEFGLPMGDYFDGFLREESRNLGLTLDAIKAWQPPQRAAGRGKRKAKESAKEAGG